MNFIVGLSLSEDHNVVWVVIDRLIKERHYVSCTINDEGTFVKSTVEMLIKKVFRIYELSALIMSDRGPQFVVTI